MEAVPFLYIFFIYFLFNVMFSLSFSHFDSIYIYMLCGDLEWKLFVITGTLII